MLRPLGKSVVIKEFEQDNTTESGIILPGQSVPKHNIATVLAVGPEVEELKEGDIVVYSKYAGIDVTFEGEKLLIVNANDILAKKGDIE